MKEYLFLFRGGDGDILQQSPEKWQAHIQKWMEWMGRLLKKGQLVSAQPLSRNGRQITGNKKTITDGPFAEGKEMVGGYLICWAENYDAALGIAGECPILDFDDGKIEVREIQELKM